MRIQKLPSADSAMLTVSTTARTIEQFIALADSPTSDGFEFFDGANFVELFVESGDIRYMLDGNAPTATLGTPAAEGSSITLMSVDLSKVKLIRQGGADATVVVVRSGEAKEGEFQESTPGSVAGGVVEEAVYAEDAAVAAGGKGMLGMTKRQDTPIEDTSTDGDAQPVKSNNIGATYVEEVNRAGGEDNTNNLFQVVQKPIAIATYSPATYRSLALEPSEQIKSSPGNVISVGVRIDSTAATDDYYLHIVNLDAVPADGAYADPTDDLKFVKKISHVNGFDSNYAVDFTANNGIHCDVGVLVLISTTEFTKTLAGSVASFLVLYK